MEDKELLKLWESVRCDLKQVTETKVRSSIAMNSQSHEVTHTLLYFCDASSVAYAAAVYLLQTNKQSGFKVDLLFSKTRLAPLKTMSIPRLELLAVLIGVRCVEFVKTQLNDRIQKTFLLTGSQCVLQWIKSEKELSVFVRNRIKEIREHNDMLC